MERNPRRFTPKIKVVEDTKAAIEKAGPQFRALVKKLPQFQVMFAAQPTK